MRPESATPSSHPTLAAELEAVEARLRAMVASREPRLTEIAEHLITAGGKRIRPLVAISIFRACGGEDARDIVDVATALELIHSATLLHDDIIDGGDTRRGKPSAYRLWGAADTLVAGDFLFSRAFELCGRFDERIVGWASAACVALTEGEILQGRFRRNLDVRVEDYREIIDRKTACLFTQGARVAAHLAGLPVDRVERLAEAGRAVGMAFQIIDDLLDVIGEPIATGKPAGLDLREGNPSLPIVLTLPYDDLVRRVWSQGTDDEASGWEPALDRLRRSPAIEAVRSEALEWSGRAVAEIRRLPPSAHQDTLLALATELTDRIA